MMPDTQAVSKAPRSQSKPTTCLANLKASRVPEYKIHAFKISKAALDARKDLDGQDCIDVPEEATLNRLGLTIADVTVGWSFAEITFDIQQVCPAEGC